VSEPLDVVLADPHAPTRIRFRTALEADGCRVVAEAADAAGAVSAVRAHRPDACLLDVHLTGSGIAAAAEIASAVPGTAVVMVTTSRDEADLLAALLAGASGYLLKDAHPARLAPALRGALAGEAVLPQPLVARMVARFGPRAGSGLAPECRSLASGLTDREGEVLALMMEGLSTEAIAGRLFVAPVTVRTHIRAVLRKLQAPDRATAIRVCREESSASA
jgi:two-component system NarL family response regulator